MEPSNKLKLIAGIKYNFLTTTGNHRSIKWKNEWECVCICGVVKYINAHLVSSGKVKSCGCIRKTRPNRKTHGKSRTKMYNRWFKMLERCRNEANAAYKNYGGRGISVCDEWLDYEVFYRDMGEPPFKGAEIDRRNNDLGYNKENCRWVNRKTNSNNTRQCHNVTYDGETKTITEWAESIGMNPKTLMTRFERGWSVKKALSIPTITTFKRKSIQQFIGC